MGKRNLTESRSLEHLSLCVHPVPCLVLEVFGLTSHLEVHGMVGPVKKGWVNVLAVLSVLICPTN